MAIFYSINIAMSNSRMVYFCKKNTSTMVYFFRNNKKMVGTRGPNLIITFPNIHMQNVVTH